jgi:hypothetical protein
VKLAAPAKLAGGVNVNEPFAFNVSVPTAGGVTSTALTAGLSPSVSLARTPGAATVSTAP